MNVESSRPASLCACDIERKILPRSAMLVDVYPLSIQRDTASGRAEQALEALFTSSARHVEPSSAQSKTFQGSGELFFATFIEFSGKVLRQSEAKGESKFNYIGKSSSSISSSE
jgi:hypothetical protein